ncbi:MAG: hypothetical protein PHN78_02920 [Dehalococcoidales bacterium]|nr:hypothetical protein [Dehalococcoidales bacterium]
MIDRIISNLREILFNIKWTFMSPGAKYAYLWNQTTSNEYTSRRED